MNYCKSSILFFLSLILLVTHAFAQTISTYKISGTVISAVTGSPFSNGNILVDKKVYPCDSAGNFLIPDLPAGTYKLSFTVDYATKDTMITLANKDAFVKWIVDYGCLFYSKVAALRNLEQGVAILVTKPDFAPQADFTGKDFKKKYNVSYQITGCVMPDRWECIEAYNKIVIEYLDKKYGDRWRKEVRKDILGL